MKYSSLSLQYEGGALKLLDQTLLPHQEVWREASSPRELIPLIQSLAVRGAPLIGVSAALCLGTFARRSDFSTWMEWSRKLAQARPTAVNLSLAVERVVRDLNEGSDEWRSQALERAEEILREDIDLCEKLAQKGAPLIAEGDGVLTHCNTGALATAGIGTALGVIGRAFEQGKKIHVYVDETRPLDQGARLTTWELGKLGIPHTLICDNMAAFLMSQGKVQKVFVGADRIAVNGDVANKIGTYSVAVNARHHGIPFYVVAPNTTCDPHCPRGTNIPIEERQPEEVRGEIAPREARVWNPAFDVTPRELITDLIIL